MSAALNTGHCNKDGSIFHAANGERVLSKRNNNSGNSSALCFVNSHSKSKIKWKWLSDLHFCNRRNWIACGEVILIPIVGGAHVFGNWKNDVSSAAVNVVLAAEDFKLVKLLFSFLRDWLVVKGL